MICCIIYWNHLFFVYLLILNGLKVKNYLRINILIIEIIKLVIKSLKIKNQLTVCFYHVTYAFQSESTLYSCLNVKELLARSRREI